MSAPRANSSMRGAAALWVLFTIVVLVGVGAAAVLFESGSNSSNNSNNSNGSNDDGSSGQPGSTLSSTTTTQFALPAFRSYKVTTGVNIRSGPGTTYAVVGTVETGNEVVVVCVIDGETIPGPVAPSNKWLRVVYSQLTGYITSQYVATGAAIGDPSVIAVCKSP